MEVLKKIRFTDSSDCHREVCIIDKGIIEFSKSFKFGKFYEGHVRGLKNFVWRKFGKNESPFFGFEIEWRGFEAFEYAELDFLHAGMV